ncbi:MAG: DEAD/DEAH box helicase, partial [Verrucomicrobia bacterium]|nr:DEAD/DEAH box helicase [Verrucomicrobiota bacterium]
MKEPRDGRGAEAPPTFRKPPIIVASVQSLLQRTFSPQAFRSLLLELCVGQEVEMASLIERLAALGYAREAQVQERGQFAVRGGILDLFPLDEPTPLRVEFFGDSIDSLRRFDVATQVSGERIERAKIAPAGEVGLLAQWLKNVGGASAPRPSSVPASNADTAVRAALPTSSGHTHGERQNSTLSKVWNFPKPPTSAKSFPVRAVSSQSNSADRSVRITDGGRRGAETAPTFQADRLKPELQRGGSDVGVQASACGPLGDLLDFLPSDTLIVLDEPDRLAEAAQRYEKDLPQDDPFHLPFARLLRWPHAVALSDVVSRESVELTINSLEAFRPLSGTMPEPGAAEKEREKFFAQFRRWCEQDFDVFVFCNNDGERQRLLEILSLHGLGNVPLQLRIGTLTQGFIWPEARLVVVSDAEIFGRYRVLRPRRLAQRLPHETRRISDVSELAEGDFVVHVGHGIAQYHGLQEVDLGGARQEVMTLEYAGGAMLYVPVTQAHLITRYVGAGRAAPPLSKLGSLAWRRSRDDAAQATRDLAAELLDIQAARATLEGHAFKLDTPWQKEFEAAFIYDETPDQLTSAEEIKRDMEAAKPMDRLLCGDVGYGKTEVAMRAAFKTVMDGKQVAVLVPTTVLAQQHFNTFCERIAD